MEKLVGIDIWIVFVWCVGIFVVVYVFVIILYWKKVSGLMLSEMECFDWGFFLVGVFCCVWCVFFWLCFVVLGCFRL